jgi:PucR family transcriptional regulator, purine catabolism regulatory protein
LLRIAINRETLDLMARRLRELSDIALTPLIGRRLRVSDVLALPGLKGARVVAGVPGLSRPLVRVNVMQVPTAEFARRDELVLAASSAFDELQDPSVLIDALGERGVAALAAQGPTLRKLGPAGLATAEARSLPLLELPSSAKLNALLTELLEALMASQATHLRLAGAVRDELIDVVISGGGLQRLVRAIADLAGGSIAIIDADGAALAVSDEADRAAAQQVAAVWLKEEWTAPAAAGDSWLLWPILAAGSRLGCVAARLREPREPIMLAAVQSGARNAAFEILHELEEAAAVTRLTEQFVCDLLEGVLDPAAARHRATAVGWNTGAPYQMLVARQTGGASAGIIDAVRRLSTAGLIMLYEGDCLSLLPATASPTAAGEGRCMRSVRALAAELSDVRMGLSAVHTEPAQLALAHAEAKEALACAEHFDRRFHCREFDALGPLRMLSHVPAGALRSFERDTLAPLDGLDTEQREALSATLSLLVDTGLNVAETARRGGWHYNTVRYRVVRLTELLGPFMEDGARLDSITLALLLRRELRAGDLRAG